MEIVQWLLTIFGLGSLGLSVWRGWRWCFDAVGALWRVLPTGMRILLRQEGAVINILAKAPGVYIRGGVGLSLEAIRAQSLTAKALRCIIAPVVYLFLLAFVLKCSLVLATQVQIAILRGLVTALKMMPRVVDLYRRSRPSKAPTPYARRFALPSSLRVPKAGAFLTK